MSPRELLEGMLRTLTELADLAEGSKDDWDADRNRQLAATYLLVTIGNAARTWEHAAPTSGRPFRSAIRLRDRIAHLPLPALLDTDIIWRTARINGPQLDERLRTLLD